MKPVYIALFLFGMLSMTAGVLAQGAKITVYKNPSCSCCKKWIRHLERNGFTVDARNVKNVIPYKIKFGVTPKLASCHTAVIGGYVIEGHVPAADIKRLLKQRLNVKGLSVPGMPIGSPGMEQGQRRDRYDVLQINNDGNASVYSRH